MKAFQRLVVVVLLGVWTFPAVSLAKPLPAQSGEAARPSGEPSQMPSSKPSSELAAVPSSPNLETDTLAAREQQAQDLKNFKGGGVEIYIGSGALLVIIIILLIVLV